MFLLKITLFSVQKRQKSSKMLKMVENSQNRLKQGQNGQNKSGNRSRTTFLVKIHVFHGAEGAV